MNIKQLDVRAKRELAQAHRDGDYKNVFRILKSNKVKMNDCCVNAFILREWCNYWTENKEIPISIKL